MRLDELELPDKSGRWRGQRLWFGPRGIRIWRTPINTWLIFSLSGSDTAPNILDTYPEEWRTGHVPEKRLLPPLVAQAVLIQLLREVTDAA